MTWTKFVLKEEGLVFLGNLPRFRPFHVTCNGDVWVSSHKPKVTTPEFHGLGTRNGVILRSNHSSKQPFAPLLMNSYGFGRKERGRYISIVA